MGHCTSCITASWESFSQPEIDKNTSMPIYPGLYHDTMIALGQISGPWSERPSSERESLNR
jgi:hypothetical protein